jgi:Uma2 family endonuclease
MSLAEPVTRRFTRDEYYVMVDAGLFDGQRVELIEGEIVAMAPQRDQHAAAVRLTEHALRAVFTHGFTVQTQLPLDLGSSQPEPDVAVLRGTPRQIETHPTTALLIVEISDTTLRQDRLRKAPLYAAANVTDYWILNLVDRRLEVLRTPQRNPDGTWSYAETQAFPDTESVSPLAMPGVRVNVSDLLP